MNNSDDRLLSRLQELQRIARESKARAESDLAAAERDLAAVDRVLKLLGKNSNGLHESETQIGETLEFLPVTPDDESLPSQNVARTTGTSGYPEKIRITHEIRNAIQEFEGEFTQQDVVRWIKDKHPSAEVRPTTVSSTLWRMAENGKHIVKVREGSGSEPNVYRRILPHEDVEENPTNEENPIAEESDMSS